MARREKILHVAIALSLSSAAWLAAPPSAHACSLAPHFEFETDSSLDPDEVDDPEAVKLQVGNITRGSEGESAACDDNGGLELRVEPHPGETGYFFEVVEGDAPQFYQHDSNTPVQLSDDGYITLNWGDGLSDDQEPLDFKMTVTPVNRAGELGPTSQPLHITHPGTSGWGCTTTGSTPPTSTLALLGLGALGLLGWRRRRG